MRIKTYHTILFFSRLSIIDKDHLKLLYMSQHQYLCLLRGINVGGNNIIKMADLRSCFDEMGFEGVQTYIQSGNVLFRSAEKDTIKLETKIEKQLSKTFDYNGIVVVVTEGKLKEAVEKAPKGFGTKPDKYRYDVIFLKAPMTPVEAMKSVQLRDGIDQAYKGKSVLYFSRLISKAGQSYLSKVVGTPVYQFMTIRNWNTTSRLKEMVGE